MAHVPRRFFLFLSLHDWLADSFDLLNLSTNASHLFHDFVFGITVTMFVFRFGYTSVIILCKIFLVSKPTEFHNQQLQALLSLMYNCRSLVLMFVLEVPKVRLCRRQ